MEGKPSLTVIREIMGVFAASGMRVTASPRGVSLDSALPAHSSLPVLEPTASRTGSFALLATFLVHHGSQAVGGLELVSSGPFQAHATSLRIAEERAQLDEREVALTLLRHASRNVVPLRGGGALLARVEGEHESLLLNCGFNHSIPQPSVSDGPRRDQPPKAARELVFWARRSPGEANEASHAALQVSSLGARV